MELSATCSSDRFGQQASATDQVGMVGLEPTIPCARNTWACRYPTSRSKVRTAGFEPAFPWPPARCDARLRHVLIEYPVGESNPNPTGIRSPSACPLDGAACARTYSAKWAGRRSNPRLRVFSPPLHHLSYQPANLAPAGLISPPTCTWFFRTNSGHAKQKNPMSLVTPGFG